MRYTPNAFGGVLFVLSEVAKDLLEPLGLEAPHSLLSSHVVGERRAFPLARASARREEHLPEVAAHMACDLGGAVRHLTRRGLSQVVLGRGHTMRFTQLADVDADEVAVHQS